MTGEEYTAFLRARKPEVYIQNSSGVPVKWIVTRAYINGVSAERRVNNEARDYNHTDAGFFPIAMLMTKEQAAKRQEELAEKAIETGKKIRAVAQQHKKEREEILGGEIELAKKIKRGKVCAGCGAIFRTKGEEKYCKTCMKKGVTCGIE